MKKKIISFVASLLLLTSCGEDYSKYPEWARDFVRDGYVYVNEVDQTKINDYLDEIVIFPEIKNEEDGLLYGYTRPTNGRPPFFEVLFLGESRLSYRPILEGLNYTYTTYGMSDYYTIESRGYAIKINDVFLDETMSSVYMTSLNFYKAEDAPYVNK